jgi:hypothetical protein
MRRHDLLGRILGIIVFLGGVAALALVFMTAFHFFNSPLGEIKPPTHTPSTVAPATQLGNSALNMLIRIGLLIVMTIAGSLIAGRGVQMYFASTEPAHPRESIAPKD